MSYRWGDNKGLEEEDRMRVKERRGQEGREERERRRENDRSMILVTSEPQCTAPLNDQSNLVQSKQITV